MLLLCLIDLFQAPGPEPKWKGVFEAINENIRCLQLNNDFGNDTTPANQKTMGQDDCLILNVYTPLTITRLLPVMVFIHGGAFLQGSSSKMLYGPEYLISKEIILVTINYRLNVEGFLCLGIKEAPGNAGMKDQVAALKWVQENIKAFGGDPNDVTLFGESAGSASVSFHVLSPMSKGLFHKAIEQSGSSISSWAIQFDPIDAAIFKAQAAGYTGTSKDPNDLYNFFISKTDEEIITSLTKRVEGNVVQSRMIFSPCVENQLVGVEPFLTELPMTTLSKGRYNKVPMIIGSNSEEGILFLSMESDDFIPDLKIEVSLPKNLVYPNSAVKSKIADEVTKLYMGDENISMASIRKLSKYFGEPFNNYPPLEEIDLIVKTNPHPVYNYYFKYDGRRNIGKSQAKKELRSIAGAAHADDLFYLFSQWWLPSMFENRMIQAMSTMWTNFAKYG